MVSDEKLEEVLHALVGEMSLRSTRVEIPHAGGLSLRMSMERMEGRKWLRLENSDNHTEKIWLRLEDRDGDLLAAYDSRGYPNEAIEDGDMLRAILEILADRLVAGSGQWRGLAELVTQRSQAARSRLVHMRYVAGGIPQAEKTLTDAELAAGWVIQMGREEVGEPAV
jgi:hypothetical protein